MSDDLLLDTCALLWLASGSRNLSKDARRQIDAASSVFVSPISAWEISLKVEKDELELPLEPEDWFGQAVEAHDLILSELSPEVLIFANRLPWHHRDPADRFILSTAKMMRLTIVTGDKKFEAYGVPHIS